MYFSFPEAPTVNQFPRILKLDVSLIHYDHVCSFLRTLGRSALSAAWHERLMMSEVRHQAKKIHLLSPF